jgi:hypothetical protein
MDTWKLFLDDYRKPNYSGFTIAKSATEAIELIKEKGCPSFISFDHDLAEDHYAPTDSRYNKPSECMTGYDFAHWLVFKDMEARGNFIPKDFAFHVHSANPVGAENIRKLMESYLKYKTEEYTHL